MKKIKFAGFSALVLALVFSLIMVGGVAAQDMNKIAVIFPGSVQDADFNVTNYEICRL